MFHLAGYAITRTLYSGRHTTLLIAQRLSDSAVVAIKKSASDPSSARDRAFLRHEFELLQNLKLPGVVGAHALAEYEGGVALVLDALPGETLDIQLHRGRLGLGEALRIAIAITDSVAGVHSFGVVHKDLKPHHIFYDAETRCARLIDFGIATSLEHAEQPARSPEGLEGTLAYISPEQTGRVAIAVDRRSDLYSLGVLFYELFTGALPFATVDPMEMIYCHLARRPIPPHVRAPEVPEPISHLVMKLLAKQPEDRYQSAYGLRSDLQACLRMLETQGSLSDLPIGTHDISYDLRMPQRLYGRDNEQKVLLTALAQVRGGESRLVLVSGYSGVGKSALINQIRRMVTQESGRFTSGKFEQLSRNAPYSSLARALGGLLQLVLAQRPEAVAGWRDELRRALGDNVPILSEAIPELTLLMGAQPTAAALGPAESQNRFDAAFEQLVRAFCGPGQALCILLDDLQWADAASLRLLQVLLGPGGPRGLLLIGAYRDNEVDAAHPLRLTMDALRREGAALTEIALLPLGLPELSLLLGDMLTQKPQEIEPLARLVYEKTRGNPFFVGQFVSALYRDGLIRFSVPLARWEWDITEIARRDATDNVIAFMADRLKRFPVEVQQALSLAACIGHEFDLGTLAVICEHSLGDTARLLGPALTEGLLLALDSELRYAPHLDAGAVSEVAGHGVYRFLHDRVQQAAYSLIAAADTAVVRLRIGRRLLARLRLAATGEHPAPGAEEQLFDVVDHLNQGRALVADAAERRQLAVLNRRAGNLARARAAFSAAAEYFNAGLELFAAAAGDAELGQALLLGAAEAESLCGRFARAEERFEQFERSADSALDRARATSLRLKLYQVAGRYREGVRLAERALFTLGVPLPQTAAESQAAIAAEVAEIERNLAGRSIEELVDAPLASDPQVCAIIDLLVNLAPCAYIGQPDAFPAIALKMVNLSLRHGNTPASCFAYSVYGFMLVAVFNDTRAGHRFSEMSIRLNEKLGDIALRGTLLHLHGDHINFWTRHIRTDFPILERAFLACQQAGDHVYGNYVAFEIIWQYYEAGDPLDVVLAASERFALFARKTHNEAVYQTIRLEQQFLRSLLGTTAAPFQLAADGFQEAESLAIINQASFGCGTAFYHIIQMLLAFRRGELAAAYKEAEAVVPYLGAVMAMPIEATFHFYRVLLFCAMAAEGTQEEQEARAATRRSDLARLARWAEHSPETFAAKYLMARAEVARLDGQLVDALSDYDAAIDAAAASGFLQYQSLASELAADCYLRIGRVRPARLYLESAARLAQRWGGRALATVLEARLGQLQPARTSLGEETLATSLVSPGNTLTAHEITNRLLDVATVLRAAQAIAGEIDMQRLLERVLRIILTNSGAQRGVLVLAALEEDAPAASTAAASFVIVGVAALEPEEVRTGLSLPMEENWREVPVSAIRFAGHLREPLFVPDALHDLRFATDPYIVTQKVQSLLCLPLLHQNNLTGVLYLESTTVRDAFSTERTEVLRLLCTQVAIAMENARLYARLRGTSAKLHEANSRLESDVALRTAELHQANQHLLHRSEQLDQVNQQLQQELQERQRAEQERRAIEQERTRLKDEIIRAQEAHLLEVATPLIPIAPEIMVMPLIGTMDSARAKQVLTTALEGAQAHRAQVVILDITGLRHVDTAVAGTLMNAARTLRLLGTRAVLTGIRAEVAQTLVALGVDLSGITTLTNLQSGIAFAYRLIGRIPAHKTP